jgi:PKD repeat protein
VKKSNWIVVTFILAFGMIGILLHFLGTSSRNALAFSILKPGLNTSASSGPTISAWRINPWAAPADGKTLVIITSTVIDTDTDLTGVVVDLSKLGREANTSLYDDGLHSDGGKNDGMYGVVFTIPTNIPTGEIPITLTAMDALGDQAFVTSTFALLSPITSTWPTSLPNFLGWGTGDIGWELTTTLPWNYNSTFLTWKWQNWGNNYVTKYVTLAWSNNEIPIFTFDMLIGGADCGGLDELNCDYAHLQDPSIMQGYFDRVTAAATQAVGSQPVIFHIESDASAYMQEYSIYHAGENGIIADDPTTIPAQSLDPNYPNTYAGAIQRMVDIIHTQAPNALVGLHARQWATTRDVGRSKDPNLDIAGIGRRTASFLTKAGGPHLDLIFTDWTIWDAGMGPPVGVWWDDTNQTLPNFNRILYWQNQIALQSNLRLFLWKVPAGNMGLDNTCHRYQDNKVDYAFTHPSDLLNAGIIGVDIHGSPTDFDCRTTPKFDNDNILRKATVYYARPSTPASLTGRFTSQPGQIWVSWHANPEFDVVRYEIYLGHDPNHLSQYMDVQKQTSLLMSLPSEGPWYLSVSAVDAAGLESPLSTPIELQLGIGVIPNNLESTQVVGKITTQTLTVSNSLGITLTYEIAIGNDPPKRRFLVHEGQDIAWLFVNPMSGTIPNNDSAPINVTFNSTGLQPAVYTTTLHVLSNDPLTPKVDVPVTLTVLPIAPESVVITGPEVGMVGERQDFIASVNPLTTTLPLNYLWQADGQLPITHTSGLTDTINYNWELLGAQGITVTASNSGGPIVGTHVITIVDIPISGLLSSNNSPTQLGECTTLSATIQAGTNVVYTWDFGDAQFGNGQTVAHTYSAVGVYTATVTASNSVGSKTAITQVAIKDVPISGIVASNNSPTRLGESTTLSATIQAGTNVIYTWDFGDGENGSGNFVNHTYPAMSLYTATVTATNSISSQTNTTHITITDVPIDGLSARNDSPTLLKEAITFTATVTSGTNVIFTWDFGDDSTGSGGTITHTYSIAGVYTATVTAMNSTNTLTDTTQVTIVSPIYMPLVVKFARFGSSHSSSDPEGGVLLGLVMVGMVGSWKRRM